MEFAAFAERVDEIAAEPSDLGTVALVAELLADADEALPTVARFVQGRVFPAHDGRTLSVGSALLHETLARAAAGDVTAADVEARLAEVGEIGAVAADYEFGAQTGLAAFGGGGGTDPLTVAEVATAFETVAEAEGDGSADTRRDTLFGLFNRASPAEAKYLARLVMGEMRVGVGEGTVRDAVAEAFLGVDVSGGVDGNGGDGDGGSGDGGESSADATAADAGDTDSGEPGVASLDAFADDPESGGSSDDAPGAASDDDPGAASDDDPGAASDDPAEPLDRAAALELVADALQVTNDCGHVARVAREEGPAGLSELGLVVGRPVQSMLAQSGTVTGAVDDWERVTVETKFDGARVQIHATGGVDGEGVEEVTVYSRNTEDVTAALPEVVDHVREHLRAPAILDGEVVAVDDDGDPLPFQQVLRRFRRKHDVDRVREEVAVELRVFDCLHVGDPFADATLALDEGDGTTADEETDVTADEEPGVTADEAPPWTRRDPPVDLLDAPLVERHRWARGVLPHGVADLVVTDDPTAIEAIEADALAAGHEGVMLKRPDSTYDAGSRGQAWRKRKPDVETLDLVVTGAEWGEGRRAEQFGTFEVAVRVGDAPAEDDDDADPSARPGDGGAPAPPGDEDTPNPPGDENAPAPPDGEYAPVGKVATGITDERLAALTDRLRDHVVREDGVDVTVEPRVVFEVGYEEIQISPAYDAGYALRFPRFLGVREDLDPSGADTWTRLDRLARRQ
ncbi:DNA ligase [Halobaculum sp. MBLA0147]|uniref:ATP-dependent DNA ligase n=1 Tax=Halobaculum sp. MBLA0147 TaxID=3079934 RepID=UPI003524092A